MNAFLESLKLLKESEDHIEFKEAKNDFNYNGGSHNDPKERRHCILGYVAALANEGGGRLVFGMADKRPHDIVGTSYEKNNLGALEDAIYDAHGIRVRIQEEFDGDTSTGLEKGRRVVIFNVPSRPLGKMLKFEGVPLMRVGESLREMSDDEMRKILNEQEPDFSVKVCEGLRIEDLDAKAIEVMKKKYSEKNENPSFATMPDEQALSDLGLLVDGKLNYAALVLLGKGEVIKRILPQNNVVIEYRKDPASIQYDDRQEFQMPLFLGIEEIWKYLNQPSSNPMKHIDESPYIFDIKAFNKDAIREGILNAMAHRSMLIQSDVVIKQSPNELTITNAGGFPIGVDLSNILTVNSTPRSKALTEVLQKTGLVERSGQGVDKMFNRCIMEAKHLPDYTGTDSYQVALTFRTEIRSVPFLVFIRRKQDERPVENKLNVLELIMLYKVQFGFGKDETPDDRIVDKLVDEGLLQRAKNGKLSLAKEYYAIEQEIHNVNDVDWLGILDGCFKKSSLISRKQYSAALPDFLSVDQVRYALSKFEAQGMIEREGIGKGTKYRKLKELI